jgi:hypothetical protein
VKSAFAEGLKCRFPVVTDEDALKVLNHPAGATFEAIEWSR